MLYLLLHLACGPDDPTTPFAPLIPSVPEAPLAPSPPGAPMSPRYPTSQSHTITNIVGIVIENILKIYLFDKRRVLAALRCGCLPLEIEKGRLRHPKVDLESRICQLCNCCAIEDSTHFITTCPAFNHIRCNLFAECSLLSPNFYSYPSIQKNHFILTYPNQKISNYIYSMYIHRKSLTHSH